MSDLKKAVFLIGDDKELSAKLQKLLIDKGYAWGASLDFLLSSSAKPL